MIKDNSSQVYFNLYGFTKEEEPLNIIGG